MVDTHDNQDNKSVEKSSKGLDKKKLGLGIVTGILVLGLGGFVLSSVTRSNEGEPNENDAIVIDEFDNLEDYLVDTYSDQEHVEDFTYFSHNVTDEELMFFDFSDEDVIVPDYEQGSYAGTVEYNETSQFYAFDVDVEGVEFPITDTVTKRVLIPSNDLAGYTDDFRAMFFDGETLSVDTSYFTGDIDYGLVQVLVPDLQIYTHIRYVQPGTYEYMLAEDFTQESESEGYVVSKDYYEIGGQLYLRYEIVDQKTNEDEVNDVSDDIVTEDPDPEDLLKGNEEIIDGEPVIMDDDDDQENNEDVTELEESEQTDE